MVSLLFSCCLIVVVADRGGHLLGADANLIVVVVRRVAVVAPSAMRHGFVRRFVGLLEIRTYGGQCLLSSLYCCSFWDLFCSVDVVVWCVVCVVMERVSDE